VAVKASTYFWAWSVPMALSATSRTGWRSLNGKTDAREQRAQCGHHHWEHGPQKNAAGAAVEPVVEGLDVSLMRKVLFVSELKLYGRLATIIGLDFSECARALNFRSVSSSMSAYT